MDMCAHATSFKAFFLFLTSLMEYNCFTVLCQFLLYNKVSQLYVYMYPHIPSLSRVPPTLPIHPSRWSQSTKLISLCYAAALHQLPILHLVVYICQCHSLTLSQLSLPPPWVFKSIHYVCIFFPILPLGSSEPFLVQKYRSMEQDRQPRGKPMHIWSPYLC